MKTRGSGADDAGWEDYHGQMFNLTPAPNTFIAWKRQSTGVNVARGLMAARNRGCAAWIADHGDDPDAWPLLHPPAVLWMPFAATAACLRCTWVHGPSALSVDEAAVLARGHSEAHLPDSDQVTLLLWRQLPVWRRDPEAAGPRWAAARGRPERSPDQ